MPTVKLGKTLVIANPVAHSGRGAAGAETVRRLFDVYESATEGFELKLTTAPGDAKAMALAAGGYDSVIALGGDGVIHEVANGLMAIEASRRPRMGVIPLGSGNDFARTLGMTLNRPEDSVSELLRGGERAFDVGWVTSDLHPEREHVLETLSFGLDAAIALDTTTRRAAGTRQEGSGLFVTSSLKLLARARQPIPCEATIDDDAPRKLETLIFAINNGPTYGGGFRICPKAVPTDGWLDVCFTVRQPWVGHLLVLFACARFGMHAGSRAIRLRRARSVKLDFGETQPPCQVDGEELRGSRFSVGLQPAALRLIVPPAFGR